MPGRFAQKIIAFLEKERASSSSDEEKENRLKAINYFKESRGECHGLAVLQAYGRRIEDEDPGETPKKGTEADDAKFFNKTKELLLNWNENEQLNPQQRSDIERLITNIMLYQRADLHGRGFELFENMIFTEMTQDPSKILQDTVRGDLIKSFDYNENNGLVATKEMLQNRLAEIVKPRSIVLIYSSKDSPTAINGHANAIYQSRNGQIYLFNDEEEIVVGSIEELTEKLWQVTDPENFRGPMEGFLWSDRIVRNIPQIQAYRFENDPIYNYPENLPITASELKSALLRSGKSMIKDFVNSADYDVVHEVYKDPSLEDENIKILLLSKLHTFKCQEPILALPSTVMSKKMLADRLATLDKKEIKSIVLTYEIDGPKDQTLLISKGFYRDDKKPLTLMGASGHKEDGFDNMSELVDTVWETSAPSNFRRFGKFNSSERYLRKCGIYVFNEVGNENAQSVCSEESIKIKAEELENFYNDNPRLKEAFVNEAPISRDPLFAAFIKQFPTNAAKTEEPKTASNLVGKLLSTVLENAVTPSFAKRLRDHVATQSKNNSDDSNQNR